MPTKARMFAIAVAVPCALVLALVVGGCAAEEPEPTALPPSVEPESPAVTPESPAEEPPSERPASAFPWADVELEDVSTGETFRISDFAGRPVLVKTFAVW